MRSKTVMARFANVLIQISWTCHICKQERPDHCISVFTTKDDPVPGFSQNIRYCNDNPECVAQAKEFRFI